MTYDQALRRLCAQIIADPNSRYVTPNLDAMDATVKVEADMQIDGYDTSGYYPEITLTVGGAPVATYGDLGVLLRDLDRVTALADPPPVHVREDNK